VIPRWQKKVVLQTAIGWLPREHLWNYLMQRYVTRRMPRADPQFDFNGLSTAVHAETWRRLGGRPLDEITAYEFGSGYDLVGATMIWAHGVDHQILLDIRPNLRRALVRHTVAQFRRRRAELESRLGRPLREPPDVSAMGLDDVLGRLGIEYLAPADGRDVPLPDAAVDLIWSTFTLEHIPPGVLTDILRENRRLLRPGGLMTFQVDLKDHFGYVDPSVGTFDFLQYEPRTWRFLNPPLHYLNRLRWPEYRAIFAAAGLEIVEENLTRGGDDDAAQLRSLPRARRFGQFTLDELMVREAHVVLRPTGAP